MSSRYSFGILLVLTFAAIGCSSEQGSLYVADSVPPGRKDAAPTEYNSQNKARLPVPGSPDERERQFRGVRVIGGALTDDHVAAILDQSREFERLDYESSAIVHEARTRAHREWTKDDLTLVAKIRVTFEFQDGRWNQTSFQGMHGIKFTSE